MQSAGITLEKVMSGPGCPACNMTGYRGRIAIHEVLVLDDEMREVINDGGLHCADCEKLQSVTRRCF